VKVVLDTNALMMPVECDVRLFEAVEELLADVEYLVPAAVIAELEDLAGSASEAARAASVGRDLAGRGERIETDQANADDAVLAAGLREPVAHVVTNDEELQRRLLDAGVSVISLRGKHKLAITQP
jgi:rRNA-processing protein FCF1